MTQLEFAEAIGTNQKVLSSYETGRSLPSLELLRKMANVLSMDLDVLVPYTKEMK